MPNLSIKSCNDFIKRGFAAQFGEKLKFLSPQQATRYFGIFTAAHRAVVPHFRFKKDLILYLNSSPAASSGEFKFKQKNSYTKNMISSYQLLLWKLRILAIYPKSNFYQKSSHYQSNIRQLIVH